MKDWAPHRHFTGTVRRQRCAVTGDDGAHAFGWIQAIVTTRQLSEICRPRLECRRNLAVAFSGATVACGAIPLERVRAVYRVQKNRWRLLALRGERRADSGKSNRSNQTDSRSRGPPRQGTECVVMCAHATCRGNARAGCGTK